MKLKTILGIALIVLSIAAMFFWESSGRDMVKTTSVLVCAEDLKAGKILSASDFRVMKVEKDSILENVLYPEDVQALEGKILNQNVMKNQQMLGTYVTEISAEKRAGQSIYVIPKEWIFSRSSAMRSGDRVSIYRIEDRELLGTYTVAFVKDSNEQEVTDLEPGAVTVLDRTDSGRVISGIEIICSLDDYCRLYESVKVQEPVESAKENTSHEEAENEADTESESETETEPIVEQSFTEEIAANLLIVLEDAV